MNLDGKKAIVLGGTSGIGLAAVQLLDSAGATVLAAGRSESNIEMARKTTEDSVTFLSLIHI